MTRWRYTALEGTGRISHGELDAADEATAVARLRRQGATPLRVQPAAGGLLNFSLLSLSREPALTREEVTGFTRELSVMIGAGQDIDRALRFLVDIAHNARARGILENLRATVRDGAPFSTALAKHPRSFSRLYVGLVRAGEAGGNLVAALERLADLLERERALTATLRTAMIYPSLLMVAATGAIWLLLTQVLPQFVPLFQQSGAHLPAATQFLIDLGAVLSDWGLLGLLLLVLLALGIRQALRSPGPRMAADRLLLRLPVVASLVRELAAARFTRTLGTLLQNGVALIPALGIAQGVVTNRVAEQAVERATASAKSGDGLAGPLAASGVFPVRTIHLLRLGEESAQLGTMALRAADIHEAAVRTSTQQLVALLTPAITILMGAAIAGIVSSLLLAMLSLNDLAH